MGDTKTCKPMIAVVPPGNASEMASSISGGTGHTSQEVVYADLRRADMKRLPSRVDEFGGVDDNHNDEASIFTSASGSGFGDAGGGYSSMPLGESGCAALWSYAVISFIYFPHQ